MAIYSFSEIKNLLVDDRLDKSKAVNSKDLLDTGPYKQYLTLTMSLKGMCISDMSLVASDGI